MAHRGLHFIFVDELGRASRKLRTHFDSRVKELGLTQARARTLLLLDRLAVLNQKELAEELDIETPTMVRLLDGLEESRDSFNAKRQKGTGAPRKFTSQ